MPENFGLGNILADCLEPARDFTASLLNQLILITTEFSVPHFQRPRGGKIFSAQNLPADGANSLKKSPN